MSKSSITVAADVAGKIMVSASGSAADRLAMAGAAAVAFIGIAVGYRIYAQARTGFRLAKPSAVVAVDQAV
ncbi:MAG TPA: hypothetical protein VJV79_01440 [Polyangiaceae bacterium]|nr:hypothetical protein [Polyangiaceae bacterium]